ncbi:MAG: hypothetical protein ACI8WB_000728, partial [Phenylobacterium sp.]
RNSVMMGFAFGFEIHQLCRVLNPMMMGFAFGSTPSYTSKRV